MYEWSVLAVEDASGVRPALRVQHGVVRCHPPSNACWGTSRVCLAAVVSAGRSGHANHPVAAAFGRWRGLHPAAGPFTPKPGSSRRIPPPGWITFSLLPWRATRHSARRCPAAPCRSSMLTTSQRPAGCPASFASRRTPTRPYIARATWRCGARDGTLEWIAPSGAECKVNGLRVDRRKVEASLRLHPHVRRVAAGLARRRGGRTGAGGLLPERRRPGGPRQR